MVRSVINEEVDYVKQGESIIMWQEGDVELAVSFKDEGGAHELWNTINLVKGKDTGEDGRFIGDVDLPEPAFDNLNTIRDELYIAAPQDAKTVLARNILEKDNYLTKLGEIFSQAEDLESLEHLQVLSDIFKGIINLGDTTIFEMLVSEENYMTVFGALEYDQQSNFKEKMSHRKFFKDSLKFRTVINISDPTVIEKIHINYRLAYLKDTALGFSIDYQIMNSMQILVLSNNSFIVSHFLRDIPSLRDLVEKIRNTASREEAIDFLVELANLTKNIEVQVRNLFFETFCQLEILDTLNQVLEDFLNQPQNWLKVVVNTTEFLNQLIQNQSQLLKRYLLPSENSTNHYQFFLNLIFAMLKFDDPGMQLQLSEVIKLLLEGETYEEKQEFLEVFYQTIFERLVSKLTMDNDSIKLSGFENRIKEQICEIVVICIRQHEGHVKQAFGSLQVVSKLTGLLKARDKCLQLAAIRALRACLGCHDEEFTKMLAQGDVVTKLIETFRVQRHRHNLVQSSILEFFNFVAREKVLPLLQHLVSNHRPYMEKLSEFSGILQIFDELTTRTDEDESKRESAMDMWAPTTSTGGVPEIKVDTIQNNGTITNVQNALANPLLAGLEAAYGNNVGDEEDEQNHSQPQNATNTNNLEAETSTTSNVAEVQQGGGSTEKRLRPIVDYDDDDDEEQDNDVIMSVQPEHKKRKIEQDAA
eukprot:CAMPEP_0114988300 /NCGR_PEP_ID=MMETSP0216-20121206/9519_1 /TAXON_ID=223996 /ORGANISM="Protocruzia adherens, Strain Boccale" /LENGTH=700 /DNA_ID=CAMNT_0002351059 /DNA_START=1128 /DNA_END=3230 /DNA_ORIENTATION=+